MRYFGYLSSADALYMPLEVLEVAVDCCWNEEASRGMSLHFFVAAGQTIKYPEPDWKAC